MSKPHITPTNKEIVMDTNDFIVSKANTKGILTYCNEIFIDMAGYEEGELLGKNHNIIRHPDMPKATFKLLWDTITAGKEFFAFVKNMSSCGSFYWVFTHISPDYDQSGTITGYTSVRRAPNRSAIAAITPLYNHMVQAERSGNINTSTQILLDFLDQNNIGYEELILSLQGDI
ncbi:MAG: PAS domain-containing protein [Campylobacterota bacterium]|nr:PAS domain-containing protein [Campylobacterota bacterium]